MNNQKMYEKFVINEMTVKNRLVASAMFEYGAHQGKITEKLFEHYHQLAIGGSGMIITGMHAITMAGATAPIMVSTDYLEYEDDLRKIVDDAHDNHARLLVQLQHCGSKTFDAEGFDHFSVNEIKEINYHEATKEEIQKVVSDFAASALRCQKAGVDGVEIHAAHGYLINTFLSPSTNHRTDEYGGIIENRARLLFEIYDAIRQACGTHFIIGVKFPYSDRNNSSITPQESLYVCQELEKKGIDFIEISAGMIMDLSNQSFTPAIKEEGPFKDFANIIASNVSIPVISVCGYRTPQFINETLENTQIAAVSFGRPLVREPDLPHRWINDQSKAKCLSCNRCCQSFTDGIITCYALK